MPAALTPVDIEAALTGWLRAALDGPRVVTELPATLQTDLPLVQVERLAGRGRDLIIDEPTVDVECFAATRADARALAYECQRLLRHVLPGQPITGGLARRVQELSGPAWRPYPNLAVRRFGLSVQITVRPGT